MHLSSQNSIHIQISTKNCKAFEKTGKKKSEETKQILKPESDMTQI